MTWTRLFWVRNIDKAFARVIPGKPMEQLAISKRYQAVNGVPWLYSANVPQKMNPRDKVPKPKKRYAKRQIRLQKIQKSLSEQEEKIIQFRQMRLNGRPLGGMDKMIAKALPSWIKSDDADKRKFRKKERQ